MGIEFTFLRGFGFGVFHMKTCNFNTLTILLGFIGVDIEWIKY